jgi:hypothetical protein
LPFLKYFSLTGSNVFLSHFTYLVDIRSRTTGKNQLAKSSWQRVAGKNQLAKISWQRIAGKN